MSTTILESLQNGYLTKKTKTPMIPCCLCLLFSLADPQRQKLHVERLNHLLTPVKKSSISSWLLSVLLFLLACRLMTYALWIVSSCIIGFSFMSLSDSQEVLWSNQVHLPITPPTPHPFFHHLDCFPVPLPPPCLPPRAAGQNKNSYSALQKYEFSALDVTVKTP